VTIAINWHELRILTMFAEKWVGSHDNPGSIKAVSAIAKRLRAQHPDLSGLLLFDDIAELQAALPDSEVSVINGPITAEDLEIPSDFKLSNHPEDDDNLV
jgi:hypothetical protein